MFSSDLLFAIKRDAYIFKKTGWFCRFPKPQKLDKSGRWLEKSNKHAGPNFTLKPNTRARSLQFCKTEIKTDIGGEKKRNKRRIYGLLVNARDVCHWTKQFKSRWKKGRQERSGDWGFEEVMFGVYLPGRYSLVFIDEGHQLELSFWYKCRSDRVEYAQNFDLSLGRLGKPATFHFSE